MMLIELEWVWIDCVGVTVFIHPLASAAVTNQDFVISQEFGLKLLAL